MRMKTCNNIKLQKIMWKCKSITNFKLKKKTYKTSVTRIWFGSSKK